ncbi:MAG: hypothetical protein KJ831_14930, partial [Candidatus Eisenbacteria bacterium]|nr:hypothetical protein [Candidatus Eisenbacteria bacterium]
MNYKTVGIMVCLSIFVLSLSIPASAEWKTGVSKDEMTGEKTCFTRSPGAQPTKPMGFPYGDIMAWLWIASDGQKEWVYIEFTDSPNLVDTELKDGYNLINTRIKWDDNLENTTLIQKWGANGLHFSDGSQAISKIAQSGTVLLELDWFSEGRIYFKFSLT